MQVGEVERYWTGGRIKVFQGTLCINVSLFYVVQVRYRITMPICLIRWKAKIFFYTFN